MMTNQALDVFQQRIRQVEVHNDFPSNFRALLDHAVELNPTGGGFNFFDQGRSMSALAVRDSVYRIAESFHKMGIGKGTHVAVLLPNLVEFPVTWLALATLGAVQVAVNNRFTAEELDYQFNDADVEFIVTAPQFLEVITPKGERQARLSPEQIILVCEQKRETYGHWQSLHDTGSPDYRPDWPIDAQELLSIQYTSGSTGLPKGCMLSQRAWIIFGCVPIAMYDHKIENIMADHSFFYIDPQWQTVSALYCGARLHVPEKLSGSRFVERIKKYDINLTLFPRPLVGEKGEPSDSDNNLKKIIAVAAGAEGIRNIRRRFGCVANDGYGMTEIGSALMLPEDLDDPDADACVGVPGPFRQARIVREDGNDCDVNEAGELLIRGEGILLGYYNKPDATASAFTGDWFHTGDLFIRNEKGYYKIVGRVKDMIRRSSENISALEVEQALTMVDGIQQVAVVSVPDDYRGEEVKAYLLLEPGETANSVPPSKVLDSARQRLAAYKLPRYIEYVTEFPYTPSNKVAKPKLVAQKKDLREGAWDAQNAR